MSKPLKRYIVSLTLAGLLAVSMTIATEVEAVWGMVIGLLCWGAVYFSIEWAAL